MVEAPEEVSMSYLRIVLMGFVLAFVSAIAHPSIVHAQPRGHENNRIEQEAEMHFRRGMEAFARSRFGDALQEFQAGYELMPSPDLLYNVGRTLQNLGRLQEALDVFRRYRAAGCPNNNCTEIDRTIRNLESYCQPAQTPIEPTPVRPTPALPTVVTAPPHAGGHIGPVVTPHPRGTVAPTPQMSALHRYGPWITMASGLVLVGATTPFAAAAASHHSMLSAAANGTQPYTNDVDNARASVGGETTTAIALGVVGGAALTSGVLWLVARPQARQQEHPPPIQPVVGWNTVGAAGTF